MENSAYSITATSGVCQLGILKGQVVSKSENI